MDRHTLGRRCTQSMSSQMSTKALGTFTMASLGNRPSKCGKRVMRLIRAEREIYLFDFEASEGGSGLSRNHARDIDCPHLNAIPAFKLLKPPLTVSGCMEEDESKISRCRSHPAYIIV